MSQVREQVQPHFFGLPAELRNTIYEDVLGDLSNKFKCFGGLSYVLKDSTSLSLWFVNRQMYQETRLLPYSMNSITAGPLIKYVEWLEQRTQDQLRAISRIHFVFDSIHVSASEVRLDAVVDFDYAAENRHAMNDLYIQKLAFPELIGLRHIHVELRSHVDHIMELAEQIELLQEAKGEIERLNPKASVVVGLNCQGVMLRGADIPASLTTGLRIIRFDRVWEGRGKSVYDILRRKGLAQSPIVTNAAARKAKMRHVWDERTKFDLPNYSERASAMLNSRSALEGPALVRQ